MTYVAEVIADSIANGVRLTSVMIRYPHGVHKDMLRHRNQSRSAESFRAQPPEDIIAALERGDGFRPEVFGKRVAGMGQRNEVIEGEVALDQNHARMLWVDNVRRACMVATEFLHLDIAKQQVNFLLQDLAFITEIITATDWDNFWALRLELKDDGNPMARPEVYKIASMMKEAFDASTPRELKDGEWHLPLVVDEEIQADLDGSPDRSMDDEIHRFWALVSAGRCARVSYARQDQEEPVEKSVERAERLLMNGHLSPFEHQARPMTMQDIMHPELSQKIMAPVSIIRRYAGQSTVHEMIHKLSCGNFYGFVQQRKLFDGEEDYGAMKELRELAEPRVADQGRVGGQLRT